MGTIVTIEVVGALIADARTQPRSSARSTGSSASKRAAPASIPTASCSRLTAAVGVAVPVSAMLFEAVQFALAVADETGGAFDPTVGRAMEARGFDRDYRTGERVTIDVDADRRTPSAIATSSRSANDSTITLRRPLVLDLGAVAKGLAIDMAARELQPLGDFAIDAGGDLYLGGTATRDGEPGRSASAIRGSDGELIETVRVSDAAVCTSGDYERAQPSERSSHPRSAHVGAGVSARPARRSSRRRRWSPTRSPRPRSCSARPKASRLLERQGVDGLIVSPALERHATRGMSALGPVA